MSSQVPAQLQIPKLNGSDAAIKLLSRFGGSKPPSRPPLKPLPNFNNIRRASNEPLPALSDFSQRRILTAEKVEQNVSAIKNIDARIKYLLSLHAAAVEANCKLNDRAAQLEDANKLLNQELTNAQNHAKLREIDFAVRKDSYQKKLQSAEEQLTRMKREQQEINNTLQLRENELKSVKSKLQTSNESLAVVGVSLQLNLAARAELERDINEQREVIRLLTIEKDKREQELAQVQEKDKQKDADYKKLQEQHLGVLQILRNNQALLDDAIAKRDVSQFQIQQMVKTQDTLLNTIKELNQAKESTTKALNDLQAQLNDAELKYQQTLRQNEQFQAANADLVKQLQKAEEDNANNTARATVLAIDNARLQSNLDDNTQKYNDLKDTLAQREASLQDARKNLQQAERDAKAADQRMKELEANINRAQEEEQNQRKNVVDTEAQLRKVTNDRDTNYKQIQDLTNRLQQAQAQLNAAQNQTKEANTANEKLRTDIEAANNRKAELENQIKNNNITKQQLEAANEKLREQQNTIEQSNADKKQLKDVNQQRASEIERLKTQLSSAAQKQETSVTELTALTTQITALNQRIEEDKKRIAELNAVSGATNEDLNRQIKANEDAIAKLTNAQTTNATLTQQLNDTLVKLTAQQQDSAQKQIELSKQREKINDIFQQLSDLGEKNRSLEEQNASLTNDLGDARNRAQANSDELTLLNKQLEEYKKTKGELESDRKTQQMQLSDATAENERLKKEIEELQLRNKGSEDSLEYMRKQLKKELEENSKHVNRQLALDKQMSQLRSSGTDTVDNERVKRLQADYAKLQEKVKLLDEVEDLVKKQSDTLKEQFGGGASIASELGEAGGFIISLKNLFTTSNAEIAKLTEEKEELRRMIQKQSNELKNQNQKQREENQRLRQGKQQVTAELAEATSKIDELTARLDSVTNQLRDAQKSLEASQNNRTDLRDNFNTQKEELEGYIKKQQEDAEEIKNLTILFNGVKGKLSEVKDALSTKDDEIADLRKQLGQRNETISTQNRRIKELEEQNADLRTQLENNQAVPRTLPTAEQEARIKELEERIKELEAENEDAENNALLAAKAGEVLNNDNLRLRTDIENATNENARLQAQLTRLTQESENIKALGDVHTRNEELNKKNQELLRRHTNINKNLNALIEKIRRNVAIDDITVSQSLASWAWSGVKNLVSGTTGDVETTQKQLNSDLDTIFSFINRKDEELIGANLKINTLNEQKGTLETEIESNKATIVILSNQSKSQINGDLQEQNNKKISDLQEKQKQLNAQLSNVRTENEKLQLQVTNLTKQKNGALLDLQKKEEEYEAQGEQLESELLAARDFQKASAKDLLKANNAIIDLFKAREEPYAALIAFGIFLKSRDLEGLNKTDIENLLREWATGTERLGLRFDFSRDTVRAILNTGGFEKHLKNKSYTKQTLRKIDTELQAIAVEGRISLRMLTKIPTHPTKEVFITRIKELSNLILKTGPTIDVTK